MSENDREPFLSRWSRRKLEPPGEQPSPAPAAPALPESTAENARPAAPASLPALDSLDGLKSDYRGFMHSGVDDGMRRGALKKLFTDPHFNKMDGLDVYIEDYSIESPIPEAMLRGLNQARSLLLFDEKEETAPANTAGPGPAALPAAATGAETQAADQAGEAAQDRASQSEDSAAGTPAPAQNTN